MWKRQANWNLLLFVGLHELILTGSCPHGWFGTGCTYMCHCSINVTCDLTTGECPPNVYCALGFLGPGCQYADLLMEMGSFQNPEFLVDGNKSTCNPDPTSTSVTATLNYSSTISWFRIHTDIDMSNRGMDARLDNKSCVGRRMYRVSENMLDVTCDKIGLVTQLMIKGPVVSHMCDLEISGGRNVALKQPTSQAGNYPFTQPENPLSGNAVDGNRDTNFEHASCSHTGVEKTAQWWQLTLDKPEKIIRIVIINRDTKQFRMHGFTLDIYSNKSATQPILTETGSEYDTPVYYFNLNSTLEPVHKIIITKKTDTDPWNNFLTLCEVELYKEHDCGESLFGLFCNQSCSCEEDQMCHPVTGACGTPCVIGQAGLQCSYPCQPNCLDNQCRDGECISCKKDFVGPYCEEGVACPVGTYGIGCTFNCSKNCLNSKCNFTGHCEACVGKLALPWCDKESGDDAGDKKETDDEFNFFKKYNLYLLLLLLLLIPLCLICLCCFMRGRKKPVEEEKAPAPAPEPEPMELGLTPEELEEIHVSGSSVDVGEESGSMTSLSRPLEAP